MSCQGKTGKTAGERLRMEPPGAPFCLWTSCLAWAVMSQTGTHAKRGPGKLWLSWSCVQSYVSLYISTLLSTFFSISGNALSSTPISTPINKPVSVRKAPPDSLSLVGTLETASSRMLTIEMAEGQSNRMLGQIGRR